MLLKLCEQSAWLQQLTENRIRLLPLQIHPMPWRNSILSYWKHWRNSKFSCIPTRLPRVRTIRYFKLDSILSYGMLWYPHSPRSLVFLTRWLLADADSKRPTELHLMRTRLPSNFESKQALLKMQRPRSNNRLLTPIHFDFPLLWMRWKIKPKCLHAMHFKLLLRPSTFTWNQGLQTMSIKLRMWFHQSMSLMCFG